MSNFNGKQQLKFKYYVSTSQPDQIWTSMGRKGEFFEGFRQKMGKNSSLKKMLENDSFRAKNGPKMDQKSIFTKKKETEFRFLEPKMGPKCKFFKQKKCYLVLWNVKFQWKTTTEVQVLRKHITAWPDLRCPKNVVST